MAFHDHYSYRLVDLKGNTIQERLEGVTGEAVDGNVNAEIRWTGSLLLEAPPTWDLWRTRIQPIYHRTGRPPEVVGTFHARPQDGAEGQGRHSTRLALYDLTVHVQEDESTGLWSEAKGVNIAARVKVIIETTGLRGISVTPSPETLRTALVFEDTVTKLHVCNTLLDAGGFFALHTNPLGQFQIRPYEPPQKRPVVYSFATRLDAEHTANRAWEYPQSVPNKYTARSRGDGDSPDLVATVYDHADWARTGFWRAESGEVDGVSSHAVLTQHAQRLLTAARQSSTVVEREILPRPLALNDIVTDASGARFTVETIDRPLRSGALMRVGMREIKET